MSSSIATTYGAILLGASCAFLFSGVLAVQCIMYFKMYPEDLLRKKLLVSVVWFLDFSHSSFIFLSLWFYFVRHFGEKRRVDLIPWSVAITVVETAVVSFIVHCFFAHKIHKASGKNRFITIPIVSLAFCRLFAACVTTAEMIKLGHFSAFESEYPGWVFTTGLSLSSSVDIIIAGFLCYFLRELRNRMGTTVMNKVVDTLTLYTLENGALTCVATVASLICWLTMPYNLCFLGLHFVITKLYANSLLASLNTRKQLRQMRTQLRNRGERDRHSGNLSPVLSSAEFAPYLPSYPRALALLNPLDRPPLFSQPSPTKSWRTDSTRRTITGVQIGIQNDIDIYRDSRDTFRRYSQYGDSTDDGASRVSTRPTTPVVLAWNQLP